MLTTYRLSAAILVGTMIMGSLLSTQSVGQQTAVDNNDDDGKPKVTLREHMRKKLAASNMILEGLTLEDMSFIKKGAQQLTEISSAEQWRIHNDVMYKQFSSDFQRISKQLQEAADDDNLDKAALKWMNLTMGCVECHRYVRNNLVVNGK